MTSINDLYNSCNCNKLVLQASSHVVYIDPMEHALTSDIQDSRMFLKFPLFACQTKPAKQEIICVLNKTCKTRQKPGSAHRAASPQVIGPDGFSSFVLLLLFQGSQFETFELVRGARRELNYRLSPDSQVARYPAHSKARGTGTMLILFLMNTTAFGETCPASLCWYSMRVTLHSWD